MTQFYTYRNAIDASPTFSVTLGSPVRLGQLQGLTEMAEHLQSGSCTLVFDDPDATLGHSGDAILGNQRFELNETACSAPRVYSGFIGIRTYQRGDSERSSLLLGASRQISVELHDYNAYASFRVFPQSSRTAIRPRETVTARFAWVTSLGALAYVSNTTYVASNTTMMDKADYRGQRPVNVLNDCELAAGFGWNCFIYWNDSTSTPGWFFDNANTSTAFSSTLQISNVISDLDTLTAATFLTGTTFAPSKDARLTRDPTELGDSAYLPYRNGAVMRTRAATTAIYGQKDIVAPNANVGSKTRAQALADNFLFQHRNEEDRITLTIEVPPSKVNLIKAGHRILCKFQHLPGYTGWNWFRVLRRAPAQTQRTDDRYEMELELSPQEGNCSVQPTEIQTRYIDGDGTYIAPIYTMTFFFTGATSPGNLIVVACMTSKGGGGQGNVVQAPTGWNWAVQNVDTATTNDHNACNVFWKKSEGESSIGIQFVSVPIGTQGRFNMVEYTGLTNPAISGSVVTNRDDPGLGYARVPAITYPTGPAAVVSVCFMEDGPQGGDNLAVSGTPSFTLRTPIAGGLHGSGEIGIADLLTAVAASGGTTPLYPAAGGERYTFTGSGPTLTAGLPFSGDNC